MPRSTTEKQKIEQEFCHIVSFPVVFGSIDGNYAPIIALTECESLYINRKEFHCINMASYSICDANLCSFDVLAKWPGSSHDRFILQASSEYDRFESVSSIILVFFKTYQITVQDNSNNQL